MERVLAVAQDDNAYEGLGMYVRFALEPALVTMSGTALFPFEEATSPVSTAPSSRGQTTCQGVVQMYLTGARAYNGIGNRW